VRNICCKGIILSINLKQTNTVNMKFTTGQTVILLDTEFKPAGQAIVCAYEEHSNKYEVSFVYPGNQTPDRIAVPEERLLIFSEMVA